MSPPRHTDLHADVPLHVDVHTDVPPLHVDTSHVDVHVDTHSDGGVHADGHADAHSDGGVHADGHVDTHADGVHVDGHVDWMPHGDLPPIHADSGSPPSPVDLLAAIATLQQQVAALQEQVGSLSAQWALQTQMLMTMTTQAQAMPGLIATLIQRFSDAIAELEQRLRVPVDQAEAMRRAYEPVLAEMQRAGAECQVAAEAVRDALRARIRAIREDL